MKQKKNNLNLKKNNLHIEGSVTRKLYRYDFIA